MDSINSSRNMYLFPEIFVENNYSNKCILETTGEEYLFTDCRDLGLHEYRRFFGSVPYESVIEYIDLAELVARRGIIITRVIEGVSNGLLIESNTKLCLIEIRGYELVVTVNEGDEILEKDKIAYIITGKNEVRIFKSPCRGLLILVINISWEKPSKYILLVVDKNACRRISIREAA